MPTPLHSTHANPVGVRGQANFAFFWHVSGIVHPKIEIETSAKCGRIGRRAPNGLDMAPIRSSSAVWWSMAGRRMLEVCCFTTYPVDIEGGLGA